jgi:hypothetical protein
MLWYDVLSYIRDKIKGMDGAPGVELGAKNPKMLSLDASGPGAVLIIRGQEAEEDNGLQSYINVTLYLECWVRSDDQSLEAGYAKLAALEERIDEALQGIRSESGIIAPGLHLMDLSVDQKTGDMDSMRPLIGSQYTVIVTVYKEGL